MAAEQDDIEVMSPLVITEEEQKRPAWGTWRVVRLTVATMAAVAAVGLIGQKRGALSLKQVSANLEVTRLDEEDEDPCEHMPFFRITGVKSSNLGLKGPDTDAEEGIIYKGEVHHAGTNHSDIELHIHAVNESVFEDNGEFEFDPKAPPEVDYEPQWAKHNGITGNFGTINVQPGSNVTIVLHGYDPKEEKDIELPKFAMTFFDLDTGKDGTRSVEFLRVNNFKNYYISNATELNVTDEGDGSMMFTATVEGTGDDNPKNPLQLTPLQKNRAVSFIFEGKKQVDFEIGCSRGLTGRVFQFVVRPVLRCAYTEMPDGTLLDADDENNPIKIARGGSVGRAVFMAPVMLVISLWRLL